MIKKALVRRSNPGRDKRTENHFAKLMSITDPKVDNPFSTEAIGKLSASEILVHGMTLFTILFCSTNSKYVVKDC